MPRAALAADGAAGASPRPALLEVSVNGHRTPEPVLLLQGEGGAFYASASLFAQWRLRLPAAQPLMFEGEAYHRLDALDGLEAVYSADAQALSITAAPSLFERQRAEFGPADDLPMTRPSTGGFVNYDLFAEYYGGEASLNGAAELGLFTPRGVGISSFVGFAGAREQRLTRLDTSWTIDRPETLTSIRIGDGISVAGPGSHPVRFAGIQYARNFAVQPGFVTMPLPVLQGSAAVPSVVDVYVNNMLQGSQTVGAGPFELANLPVPTGGGTVQLVVRDMLGRTMVAEQSYYANAGLLRRGLHDFSYDLGLVRRNFGLRSMDYGALMGSTTHRYGISDSVTAEAHVQASESVQLGGAGLLVALAGIGLVGGSAAVSRSDRGTGAHATASLERRSSGLSLGLRGQYASIDYAFVGMPERHAPARLDLQAFADAPVGGGSVGMNLVHRDNRDRVDETLAGLFGSFRLGEAAALQVFARRSVAGSAQTIVGGHLSFSFGGGRSASAGGEQRRGGSAGHIAFQQNAPAAVGDSWRVAATAGDGLGLDAQFTRSGTFATFAAQATHFEGRSGVRLSAAGALAAIGGRAYASRSLGQSFAAVEVGRYQGVRVYADNQLIGVTDASGRVMVPAMRAFDRNSVRIEEADLPMDVQVAQTELAVRPFARAGAVVSFPVRRERGLLLQLQREDGTALPPGATVQLEGDAARYVVASGGELYLPAAQGTLRLTARWGGESCSIGITVPDNDDPQPRLAGLICRREASYAAR